MAANPEKSSRFDRMSFSFQSEGLNLEYEIIGTGEKAMLAFHGFAGDKSLFRVLNPSLGKKYTIYSFNLPYHGLSTVDRETDIHGISPIQLKKYMKNFLGHIHSGNFSILGFSIGGKVALKVIELLPDEVKDIFLFAPDGIVISPWYNFITKTMMGKWIYKRLMLQPSRYMKLLRVFEFMKLVHPRTANFVRSALDTNEKRLMVYHTWMSLRNLDPDVKKVQSTINAKNNVLHLFFGRHDKLIPPSIGNHFAAGLNNKNCIHIIDAGHRLIREDINGVIIPIL
jgi:pimeloyl-ACP methyl ester carboxylesterase